MKKILVGIDGGGSNTKLLVTDFNLNMLLKDSGGASNFLKIGFEEAIKNVVQLVEPHLVDYSNFKISMVIGTAGAGRKNDAEQFENYLKKRLPNIEHIKVVSDAEITLKGAFDDENGAILISGTGSILYFKKEKEFNRVGGFGRLIGDEGSGYSIGRKGLSYIAKMIDGRKEQSLIYELAKTKLNINSTNSFIDKIYKENYDVASFAEIVINAASQGDEISMSILEEETYELLLHVETMIKREMDDKFNLVLAGGLFASDNLFKEMFIKKINSLIPQINITEPKHTPEFGAILIAKELL